MAILIFIFLLMQMESVLGQTTKPLETIVAAREAFIREDFALSVELYESLRSEGFESPELYYNLGNAYFRLGRTGKAIVNFERSLRLNPDSHNAQFNLQVALARTTDKIVPAPQMFYKRWWQNFIGLIGLDLWAKLSVFMLFLFLLSVAGFLMAQRRTKKIMFVIVLLVCVATTLSFAATHSNYIELHQKKEAIVTAPEAAGKSAPGDTSSEVFIIHEGTKVRILDELDDWYKVKLVSGQVGWIQKKLIEII